MSTNISPFNFDGHQLRTIIDDSGDPWFVAADVCYILSISNNRDAMARLDDDEKGVGSIDTLGGKQEMTTINESGLYSLILGSRKPEARKFKRWVTSEVLPSIRKTGQYSTPAAAGNIAETVKAMVASEVKALMLEQANNPLLPPTTGEDRLYTMEDMAGLCNDTINRVRSVLEVKKFLIRRSGVLKPNKHLPNGTYFSTADLTEVLWNYSTLRSVARTLYGFGGNPPKELLSEDLQATLTEGGTLALKA